MSGEVSRSYPGPDDEDTAAKVRAFMAEQAFDLEALGLCADHALPRENCHHCNAGAEGGR